MHPTGLFFIKGKERVFVPCSGHGCEDRQCLRGKTADKGTRCSKGMPAQDRIVVDKGVAHLFVLRIPEKIPFVPQYEFFGVMRS